MPRDYLEQVGKSGQTVNPIFNFLGVKVDMISYEGVQLDLDLRPDFIQGGGVTAGGIIATLADEAMAHVVLAGLAEGETTATIEMNLRFTRPVREGMLRARAWVVNKGKKVVAVTAEVRDEKQRMVAAAGASFMILPAPGGGARR